MLVISLNTVVTHKLVKGYMVLFIFFYQSVLLDILEIIFELDHFV